MADKINNKTDETDEEDIDVFLKSIEHLSPEKRVEALKQFRERLERKRQKQLEETIVLSERAEREVQNIRESIPKDKQINVEELSSRPALEEVAKTALNTTSGQIEYGGFFERLKGFYQTAERSEQIKTTLSEIKERAREGRATQQDEQAMENYAHLFESVQPVSAYIRDDKKKAEMYNLADDFRRTQTYMR